MIPRLLNIQRAVGEYERLTRAQIQEVTGEKNDRVTRKHVLQLVQKGLLSKTRMEVVSSLGATAPVYFLTRRGAEYLAAEVDEKYLHACTETPQWQTLLHTVAVVQFRIVLNKAIALQEEASIGGFLNEWTLANPEQREPHERYRLFTLLQEKPKRLVCSPDAALLLCVRGFAKVYTLEMDRATSSIHQIAASKPPGIAELVRRKLHKRFFTGEMMDTCSVLSISPTPGRRDLLRKAIRNKDGAELWKFASWTDFTAPGNVLHEAIWYPCEGHAAPLVKRAATPKTEDLAGSGLGSRGGPPRTGVRT